MKKKTKKKMSIQSEPVIEDDENDLVNLLKSKEDLATLNPQLIQKGVGFLLSILESHDEVRDIILPQLVKLGLPVILIDLLAVEISKLEGDEPLTERYPVLDVILRAIKALSVIDSCSQELCSNKKLLHLLATLIKLTDKIEVAAPCVTAAVLIANLLSDSDGLILEINKDQLFLQGLRDIFPFASDDIEARNAIWDVISRLLAQVQEGETSPLKLHQYVSVLASKSDLIEEELLDHQLAASNKDQENSTISSRNLHIRTATNHLTKTSQEQHQPQNVPEEVQEVHVPTNEELLPAEQFLRIGGCNHRFILESFECDYKIIPEILRHHPIYPIIASSVSNVPMIYIQQFWHHVVLLDEVKSDTVKTTIEAQEFTLTSEDLRTALGLPAANHGNYEDFEVLPNVNHLKEFFIELGYDKDAETFKRLSDFKRKYLPARWATLFSILNRCITGKETGMDRGTNSLYQIMYGIVNHRHFDYAKLLWIDFVDHVTGKSSTKKKKNVCIPFVRYIKLMIAQLMRQHPDISRREEDPTADESYMHSTHGGSIVTDNAPMPIPQALLDLANKESEAYKEYVGLVNASMESSKPSRPKPSRPASGTHRVTRSGAKLGSSKGKKKQLAKKSYKKVDVKAKKNVEKESDGMNELLKAIDEMVDLSPDQNLEEFFGTNAVDLSQAPEPATKEPTTKKSAPTPVSPPTITTTTSAITTPIPTTTSTPKAVPTPTPIMTKTTTTKAPSAQRNIHATAMHYVTEATFKKALDSLTGQIEERLSTFAHRQGQDVVGPSQRHQSSTMEYLKALMLMQFIDNTKLKEAEPQLFNALLDTSSQSTTENIIREEFQSIRESMDHTTSHITKAISELSDRVTSLEENCRPQSRKRHHDDPEGEKDPKRLKTSTPTRILRGRRTPRD